MQNSEDKGSLSDKFRDFGAQPSDGLWNAVSAGLDKVQPVKKTPKISGKSFFWAAIGFIAASAIATGIWLTSPDGTVPATAITSEQDSHTGQSRSSSTQTMDSADSNGTSAGNNSRTQNDQSSSTDPVAVTSGTQQTESNDEKKVSGSAGSVTTGKQQQQRKNAVSDLTKKAGQKQRIQTNGQQQRSRNGSKRNTASLRNSRQRINPKNRQPSTNDPGSKSPKGQLAGTQPGGAGETLPENSTGQKDPVNLANNPGNEQVPPRDQKSPADPGNSEAGNKMPGSGVPSGDSITGTRLSASNQGSSPADSLLISDSSSDEKEQHPPRLSAPPPAPAKWMIGGHAGVGYGKEVYLIDFKNDQYVGLDMLASSPTSQLLPTRFYWSADVTVSRRLSKQFWIESGLQGGMLTAKQEKDDPGYLYYPVEAKVFNLGIPLALRFDFKSRGRFQLYERIGTLHTFPFAINAHYVSNEYSMQPDMWKHRTYWTYDLSVYLNFGVEWAITRHLSWDARLEIRYISEMVSMHRIYNNTLWYGGSTGLVWKF